MLHWLLVLFACAAHADTKTLEIVSPGNTVKLTLEDMRKSLKPKTVKIQDPVYKTEKTFDGFALGDVLALAKVKPSDKLDEIIFTAADGYAPSTGFDKLHRYHPYLTYQEQGGKPFGDVDQGKAKVSPAPFYVIWEEGAAIEHEVPWPYQLVKIEVADLSAKYAQAYPQGAAMSSTAGRGFLVFKDQCLRCHSVNLQGGDLGPELNIPKNVTEYWTETNLKAFIKDASSFRARSKMPPFTHLKDTQITDVLAYLKHMKTHKAPAPK